LLCWIGAPLQFIVKDPFCANLLAVPNDWGHSTIRWLRDISEISQIWQPIERGFNEEFK
jgi:hypothetical protein